MVTCQWCTAEGTKLQTSDCVPCETFLMAYANGHLDDENIEAADDDLSYCFDCVTAYHHARRVVVAQSNCLNEVLSQRECYRLSTVFTRTLKDFQNAAQEVFLLDQGEEQRVGGEGVDLELALRTPIMEILENPFLLNHLDVATHLVEALCYLDTLKQPFQVDYYTHPPGVYVLILHPQEEVRRWALRSAQQLGHLSRDDYYGLRDVFLTVLNLIHSIVPQRNVGSGGGCVTALPPHLFTSANKKNFWLGVCMLLTLLDEQAMETLLLDQAPQTNILEAILSAMEMTTKDESQDPFWPTLQCLMVMLDRLGAKVWAGQNVDPMHAFHRVINSPNYRREVEKVSPVRVKQEALEPDVMTCSQIVYGTDTSTSKAMPIQQRPKAFVRPQELDILGELSTIVLMLQSDEGDSLRTHHSAFIWFLPFACSVMTIKEYGVGYISEVIHHLGMRSAHSPIHLLILASVVTLYQSHNSLPLLWCSSGCWIPIITDGACGLVTANLEPCALSNISGHVMYPKTEIVQAAERCSFRLICLLLRDGVRLKLSSECQRLLDLFNRHARFHRCRSVSDIDRELLHPSWMLSLEDRKNLEACISSIVFEHKWHAGLFASSQNLAIVTSPSGESSRQEGHAIFSKASGCNTLPQSQGKETEPTVDSELSNLKLDGGIPSLSSADDGDNAPEYGSSIKWERFRKDFVFHASSLLEDEKCQGITSEIVVNGQPDKDFQHTSDGKATTNVLSVESESNVADLAMDICAADFVEWKMTNDLNVATSPHSDDVIYISDSDSNGSYHDRVDAQVSRSNISISQFQEELESQLYDFRYEELSAEPLPLWKDEAVGVEDDEKEVRKKTKQFEIKTINSEDVTLKEVDKKKAKCGNLMEFEKGKVHKEMCGTSKKVEDVTNATISQGNKINPCGDRTAAFMFECNDGSENEKHDFQSLGASRKENQLKNGVSVMTQTSAPCVMKEENNLSPIRDSSVTIPLLSVSDVNDAVDRVDSMVVCQEPLLTDGSFVEYQEPLLTDGSFGEYQESLIIDESDHQPVHEISNQADDAPDKTTRVCNSPPTDNSSKSNNFSTPCSHPTTVTQSTKSTSSNNMISTGLSTRRRSDSPKCNMSCGRTTKNLDISPQKIRKLLRPLVETTAERLGFKKAPRHAPDLSQGSLSHVHLLRERGFHLGATSEAEKRTHKLQLRRTKLPPRERLQNSLRHREIPNVIVKASVLKKRKSPTTQLRKVLQNKAIEDGNQKKDNGNASLHEGEDAVVRLRAPTVKVYGKNQVSRAALLLEDAKREVLPLRTRLASSRTCGTAKATRSLLKPGVLEALETESHLQKAALYLPLPQKNNFRPSKQHDPNYFLNEVLRWDVHSLLSGKSYYDKQYDAEMKLPLKYDSFDHFFTTMKPLLMIETWERVVRDLAKQERNGHYLEMKLNSYYYSQKLFCGKVEGQVEHLESAQIHLSEDKLLLIWLPSSAEIDGDGGSGCLPFSDCQCHLAYVERCSWQGARQDDESQFTPASMSIKTCGNLARIVTGTFRYRCVCSLTAELRKANALISSFKSPLFRILLNPDVSDFHPPSNGKELSPPISLHEQYNESQSKAIQSAFTMIVPQPRVPKICLLEGPPGTGKSKTIVGLLQTLLSAVNNGLERGILMPGAAGINNERLERRVLICAPSNGAVDELMMKIIVTFKAQVRQKNNPKGNCGDINIVRLGSDKNINTKVTQFSVKSLADRMKNSKNVQHMQAQLSLVDKQIEALFMRQPLPLHEKQKNTLMMKRESIQRDLKEHQRKHQEVQRSVISQAHIVFSTLNSSCCVQLKDAVRFSGFSCIIVDEASQSTEIDSLVPLLYNCPKMVLVGDPKQLQPTVLSQRAKDLGYGRSLLERLLLCMKDKLKTPPLFLNIQYRMHPDICSFPSAYFYENLLLTDRMLGKMKSQFALTPYSVFDVEDGQEQQDSFNSFLNEAEAQLAVYAAECSLQSGVRSMAVITPYNGQRSYISHLLQKKFSQEDFAKVSVNTVDGFQGCEKDVVLLSCVRGCGKGATGVIGFLEDKHRLNVALTRAKLCFIIVGHLKTLQKFPHWKALITDAEQRNVIVSTTQATYSSDVKKILQERTSRPRRICFEDDGSKI